MREDEDEGAERRVLWMKGKLGTKEKREYEETVIGEE